MVLVVASTCLRSITVVSSPPTVTVVAIDTSSKSIVNVAVEEEVLVTSILVTTVVVAEGTVYRVVLDVAAAPRNRAFDTVAISYYLFS